jgi:tetratricopeptide (TPR) repeat protein
MTSGVTESVLGAVVVKKNSQSTWIDKSKFLNILVTQNSNDAEAFFNDAAAVLYQANVNLDSEDYQKAIADLTKAIKINPTYKDAYYSRAYAYRKIKNYQAAIADYTKLISLNPDNSIGYFYDRGNAYRKLKNYRAAIVDYTKAIKIIPSGAGYFNRGVVYKELKNYQAAIADYTKAIKMDFDYDNAISIVLLDNEQFREYYSIVTGYDKVIKMNPNDADAYLNRGIAYSELRDYETAASDVNKAAQLYQRQGDTKNYKQMQQMLKLLKLEEILTN